MGYNFSKLKKATLILGLAFIALLVSPNLQAQSADTTNVLFVGNSYTYFWNLPQTVSAMAASQGQVIVARKSTVGGAFWKEHWEGNRGLKTRDLIINGDWDIVVLQNQSLSTLNNQKDFMEYGKKLINLVKETGAKPLLYITWAREFNPLMQKTITATYKKLAATAGIDYAPVGPDWQKVRQLRPDLQLFDPDGSHPSPIGTYLIASVLYHTITGKPTAPIPERLVIKDKNGEDLYLSIMTKGNADFIQQVVDEYQQKTNIQEMNNQ